LLFGDMAQSFQSLDAQSLILAQTTIAFITAPFASPNYNFPLFLFGTYASERTESPDSLRLFSGLLGVSSVLDLIWVIRNHQNGFIRMLTIINLLLKAPTMFAVLNALRLRGDTFTSFASGQFAGGQNVWSMPGSFSGRDGYQNVSDGDIENQAQAVPPASAPPPPQQQPSAPPGGYQTL